MAAPRARGEAWVKAAAVFAFASPVLVVIGAFGSQMGLWSQGFGYDLLTMKIAWGLDFVGVVAALAAVALAVRSPKRLGVFAAVALIVSAGSLGVFAWQKARIASGVAEDVSTNPEDRPGFSASVQAARGQGGPVSHVGPEACAAARPVLSQVGPIEAGLALKAAGFIPRGVGVGRSDGDHTGFWFGVTHDAVIRIRPGRTDIRVAARDNRPHGGEACRLVGKISQALQAQ